MKKGKNKLPSGNVRRQILDYKDANGKKHYKSFTASSRAEVELMIAEWRVGRGETKSPSMSILEACERYVESKETVLSPTTVRSYNIIIKKHIEKDPIASIDVNQITNLDLQSWISRRMVTVSPKTTRNVFAFVKSAIELVNDDFRFKVTLPEVESSVTYCPSTDDIKTLLDHVNRSGMRDLYIAILIASICTLRRGEICGLEYSDIVGNKLHVQRNMVRGSDHSWIIKNPKTKKSVRVLLIPNELRDLLSGASGKIIECNPDTITAEFGRCVKACGLPHFRFHDLRHYSASIMQYLQISSQTARDRGGWANTGVMERVYQNTIDKEREREETILNDYFSSNLLA